MRRRGLALLLLGLLLAGTGLVLLEGELLIGPWLGLLVLSVGGLFVAAGALATRGPLTPALAVVLAALPVVVLFAGSRAPLSPVGVALFAPLVGGLPFLVAGVAVRSRAADRDRVDDRVLATVLGLALAALAGGLVLRGRPAADFVPMTFVTAAVTAPSFGLGYLLG